MKPLFLAAAFALLVAPAVAQTMPSAADAKTFASQADIDALIAKAKAEPPKPQVSETILNLPPYRVMLEYRAMAAPAAVHETEAELMYVIDGVGTIVTGGTLTAEKRMNPANLVGTGIEGGAPRTLVKGDFIIVPEGTPHQITKVPGAPLILMTFHVPRPVPGASTAK